MSLKFYSSDDAFDREVAAFQNSRTLVLTALTEELVKAITAVEEADFARIFGHAQSVLGHSDLQLSNLFKVSRPTVGRWTRGVTSPHPLLRKAVYETLLSETKVALRKSR